MWKQLALHWLAHLRLFYQLLTLNLWQDNDNNVVNTFAVWTINFNIVKIELVALLFYVVNKSHPKYESFQNNNKKEFWALLDFKSKAAPCRCDLIQQQICGFYSCLDQKFP